MNTATAEESWLILTSRYGSDIRNPSPAMVAEAVSELYGDTADVEHGSIYIRYGLPDGRMVVLNADVSGRLTLEEYGDHDFGQCKSRRIIERLSQGEAERLLQLLSAGRLTSLSNEPWINAAAP